MTEPAKKSLNRRDFGKAAVMGVGGLALAGINPAKAVAKVPDKWDQEADVVVVGAGAAGLAAAAVAAAAGKSVIVLEKTPLMGGSSLICGGALAFAGTDMQAALNIKDSNELFYKDLMTVGDNVNVQTLVKAYVDNQLDTYEWLKKSGLKFTKIGIVGGMSVPRAHYCSPADAIKVLADMAKAKGARIQMGTAASKLIINAQGQVCGVVATRGNRNFNYGARKGVVLASGGFALNKDILAKFVPPMARAKAVVGLGSQGDGLKMAWACGADIRDMPYIKATFGFGPAPDSINDRSHTYYYGAIIVNKQGHRIVDESRSYKILGDAALQQTDGIGVQIFDANVREKAAKEPHIAPLDRLTAKGWIFSADTIPELAKKAGIPADVLAETVRQYNANVEKGVDPQFGRTSLAGGFGKPVKIEKAPFYAFPSSAVILGTYGGILTNEKAQVIDVYGDPVPRLYAAGEVVGGVHGAAYMTGSAFGKAIIFGRMAGKNISA